MLRSLFDRIFTYPASPVVLPAENLATEITAYFLEHWPGFRRRFLQEVGVEHPGSDWTIETQHHLYAPGRTWHEKIPDLLLRSGDGTILILVEVKIDAGVTYSGEVSQSRLYQDYLDHECQEDRLRHAQLVLLTRWLPGDLWIEGAKSVRFSDLARWFAECMEAEPNRQLPIIGLAEQWVTFMRAKRWAMLEINESHVQAIRAMGELLPQLWDVLAAVRREVLADPARWMNPPRARSSSGTWPTGNVIWEAAVAPKANPKAAAQPGFFYGQQDGETALFPIVWFNVSLELRDCPELQVLVRPGFWGGHYVQFPSLVPLILSGTLSQQVWDEAKSQIASVFPHLQLTADSTGPTGELSGINPPSS
jgi:hypothetical protein